MAKDRGDENWEDEEGIAEEDQSQQESSCSRKVITTQKEAGQRTATC